MDEEKLDPQLQRKLDEVEREAAKERRFDGKRGIYLGLICFGLFFTSGVGLRAPAVNALAFGVIGGVVGFLSGACQRPPKQS